MRALAAAKINLYLDVLRQRDDGFHEIETVYQPVGLWDELVFEEAPHGIEVSGDESSIPWNEENLCYRAARIVFERTGCARGLRIRVSKGIPAGAGLGGGSSDAAATLVAVNGLFGLGLSREKLLGMALELGSDVPFFVLGRPAVGRGRGEILEEIPGLRGGWVLIVKPEVTVSTKWAYQNLNLVLTKGMGKARLTALLSELERFPDVRLETYNSFEAGVIERFPSVAGILAGLRSAKPVLSSLSGSGSACFAIFRDESEARQTSEHFMREGLFTRVVQPTNQAVCFDRSERSR
jgi:4-diphosphocytidyl-2-C-methyl-D-erythritol kinase